MKMGSDLKVFNQPMKPMMKRAISRTSSKSKLAAPRAGTATPRRSRADQAMAERLMSLLKAGADTRTSKVKRIRQSVRSRSYENELKLSVAMERMAQDLSV
jgi:hypothetical protein